MNKKLFAAIATLTGTAIGAGFLGIPYVASKSGFFIGLAYIVILGLIMLFVNLCLGEISLRTRGTHQLTGYAKMYLGKKAKIIMFLAMIFGIYSALLAYLIAEGESLSFLFFSHSGYAVYFALGFWIVMSVLVYIGLRALKKGESIGLILVSLIVLAILVYYLPSVKIENLTTLNAKYWFLPFGVILFSLLSFSCLPELERELRGQEKYMKKAIVIGSLIPIIIYVLFAFVVVGAIENVPEIATLALGKLFVLLGIITMYAAFFSLSVAIRDTYRFDFHLKKLLSLFLVSGLPLLLYLIVQKFKLASFIQILSIGGVVSGGITGILILFMLIKAKKSGNRKPEYSMKIGKFIILLLVLIFVIGMLLKLVKG